ncbi:U-box domain-containing protein 26-like [Impatiens glandulifera]|uniref:U-box domain-containing protein 26-like n=1 Tax=Impatiens glandulifera TaxID=253017 RepID=UPI001FB0AC86|nr:U-box domain-containing protein 26-like [Impatiens glandulifera]
MPSATKLIDLGVQIPYHFRCPISLDLMQDPVTVCTGQTYDRYGIDSWFATGNTTCPVTGSPISDLTLIPNHTLRRLIQEWCVANRSFGVRRIPTPKQPVEPHTVRSLLTQVSNGLNSFASRLSAIRRLKGLARESDKNRTVISALSAREILLSIVFDNIGGFDESSELIHDSMAILATYLPLSELDCGYVAADPDRIAFLISLLFHSNFEVRVNSAAMIEAVVAGTGSSEVRAEICKADEIYRGVIGILNSPEAHPRAVKIGIKTVFALCLVKQHRLKAVAAGAAEAIIGRLPDLEKCDAERALATVELLCRLPTGCSAFANQDLTVPILVKIILKISDRATEYAAGALLSLCSASETCRREAVVAGVWTQLLLLVQSDRTERAKRKAQMLLKLVRDVLPAINSDKLGYSDIVLY